MRPAIVHWLEQLVPPQVAAIVAPGWFMCVGLAGIVTLWWMLSRAKRRGIDQGVIATAVLWCYVGAVGAGIVVPMVIDAVQQQVSSGHWQLRWAGMTSFWGYLAGIGAVAIVCSDYKLSLARLGDMSAAPLGLALALARMGCFCAGCDYGKVTSLPWAVRFPAGSPAWQDHFASGWLAGDRASSLPVHPTQLYEAALGLTIMMIALAIEHGAWARRRNGRVFLLAATIYALGRIAIETCRGDSERGIYAGLSSGQIFSLVALAAIGACVLLRRRSLWAVAAAAIALGLVMPANADAQPAPASPTDVPGSPAPVPPTPTPPTMAVETAPGPLQTGALIGYAAPLNRRSDQVPPLAGPSLSVGYSFGLASAWLDVDNLANTEATHTTLLFAGGVSREVIHNVWLGGRVGFGPTFVHFINPVFQDAIGSTTRLEAIAEGALSKSWMVWVRPLSMDILLSSALGGPIVTYQVRIGLAYRWGWGARAAPRPAPPAPTPAPPPITAQGSP